MAIRAYYKQVKPSELDKLKTNPESELIDEVWDESDLPELDLDKAWETLHFLLTGNDKKNDSPLSKAIFGGSVLNNDDGYLDESIGAYFGSNYLTATEVNEIAQALNQVSEGNIRQKFIENDMETDWGDLEDYVLPYFKEMVTFYLDAARKENAVLVSY